MVTDTVDAPDLIVLAIFTLTNVWQLCFSMITNDKHIWYADLFKIVWSISASISELACDKKKSQQEVKLSQVQTVISTKKTKRQIKSSSQEKM